MDFPIPQNSFVWVSLKMGSRASKNPRVGSGVGHRSHREPNPAMTVFLLPLAALPPSLLIYPPTGSQWRPRAGGLWGGFPSPAKLICTAFAKNGLASSHARGTAGAAPMACADCRVRAPEPPTLDPHLSCTSPKRPTLDPNRPTLDLPQPARPPWTPPNYGNYNGQGAALPTAGGPPKIIARSHRIVPNEI